MNRRRAKSKAVTVLVFVLVLAVVPLGLAAEREGEGVTLHLMHIQTASVTREAVEAAVARFEKAAEVGIAAIIQPGGSSNDQMSIDAVDKHGMAMVFTGTRHFRH